MVLLILQIDEFLKFPMRKTPIHRFLEREFQFCSMQIIKFLMNYICFSVCFSNDNKAVNDFVRQISVQLVSLGKCKATFLFERV